MSYATGTTHYNLPQTVGSDKRDWTDTNQAFSDLDTAVYGAAQGAEAATSAIQTINSELDVIAGKQATDEENITTLNGKVSTLESTTSTLGAGVLDVRQDLQDNIESKHEASATSTHAYAIGDTFYYNDILYKATAAIAIGDTIVPTVNCMGITVMSQVSAIKGDLTASDGLGFEFMTDGDGNYGYRGADDSFVPFSRSGGVTAFFVACFDKQSTCIRDTDGTYHTEAAIIDTPTTTNIATLESWDCVSSATQTGTSNADLIITVAKAGYYLSACAGAGPVLEHKNIGDTVTLSKMISAGATGAILYFGENNPSA